MTAPEYITWIPQNAELRTPQIYFIILDMDSFVNEMEQENFVFYLFV